MSTVSIVKCDDYEKNKVEEALRKSLELIGGIDRIIKKGDKVLLKVNITAVRPPEDAITTHPSVVRAVAKVIKELGAEVWIGESPGIYYWKVWERIREKLRNKFFNKDFEVVSEFFDRLRTVENPRDVLSMRLKNEDQPVFAADELGLEEVCGECFIKTGLKEVADEIGVKTVAFDSEEWIEVPNPQGKFLRKVWVTKPIIDADVIVGMPKLKTHNLMLFTGTIKFLKQPVIWLKCLWTFSAWPGLSCQ